jgi:hypothetical protein
MIRRDDTRVFKIGDLARIQPWCKNKGRLCHVVEVYWYDPKSVRIQFLDELGLKAEPSLAASGNLELISG